MYGRPIPKPEGRDRNLNCLEMEQLKHALQVEEIVKTLMKYGNQVLLAPTDQTLHPSQPGGLVKLKTWKTRSP